MKITIVIISIIFFITLSILIIKRIKTQLYLSNQKYEIFYEKSKWQTLLGIDKDIEYNENSDAIYIQFDIDSNKYNDKNHNIVVDTDIDLEMDLIYHNGKKIHIKINSKKLDSYYYAKFKIYHNRSDYGASMKLSYKVELEKGNNGFIIKNIIINDNGKEYSRINNIAIMLRNEEI